jgi:hypothetical protein
MKYKPNCWKAALDFTIIKGKAGIFFLPANSWHEMKDLTLVFESVNNFIQ